MINVQALTGTMLGTCTLQKLIGQGAMGAVFLAQQANPSRQVAVKVVAPLTSQPPSQRAVFLQRFCQEIATIALLKHRNILPIYEYGEQDGLGYLIMPYIGGGTLRDVLVKEAPLSFSKAADYLTQLAAALDFAHQQGIVHRDVRPANVLKTSDGRLLLTDFGLIKIVAKRQTSQMRLLQAGTPVGALEYMAPEQVMGDVVDAHTDLYALGIMLYQMVTGKTPFQGGTPLQVATQLVQTSPPSPRSQRTDLSLAAEQVMVRAIAKRPTDRYASAQDFANEFRIALTTGTISTSSATTNPTTGAPVGVSRSRGLFAPTWQKVQDTGEPADDNAQSKSKADHLLPLAETNSSNTPPVATPQTPQPALPFAAAKTDEESTVNETGQLPFSFSSPPVATPQTPQPALPFATPNTTRRLPAPHNEPGNTDVMCPPEPATPNPISPFPAAQVTGPLMLSDSEHGITGTVKLIGPVKVVQVPVAGQPGHYVTGFLPLASQTQQLQQLLEPSETTDDTQKRSLKKWQKITALALIVLLVLSLSGIVLFRTHSNQSQPTRVGTRTHVATPDLQATAVSKATATAAANIILTDPLNQNIHNWPVNASGYKIYLFKNGAYHITNNDPRQSAPALLGGVDIKEPMVYTLTMAEIKGDDGSINNSFGMIFRFTSTSGNKSHTTFYTFQVENTYDGEYQFSKYDDIEGPSVDPYKAIWHHAFGKEFHQGQGSKKSNTFKIVAKGKSFTFLVNGQRVGAAQDGSLPGGEVGMIVNLKGTEVAFSNLLLTYS